MRARGTDREAEAALLARTMAVRGQMLFDLRRHEESLPVWEECVAILREHARRHPGVSRHDRALANAIASLASVHSGRQEFTAGLAAYEEALAVRGRLLAANPGQTKLRAGVGITRWNCAPNLRRLGRPDEFLESSTRALEELEGHRVVEPNDPYSRNLVENVRYTRALHHLDSNSPDAARSELVAAGELDERNRLLHAALWARCGAAFTGEDSPACYGRALDLLERAVGGPRARKILDGREIDALRDDPRFASAARRLAP